MTESTEGSYGSSTDLSTPESTMDDNSDSGSSTSGTNKSSGRSSSSSISGHSRPVSSTDLNRPSFIGKPVPLLVDVSDAPCIDHYTFQEDRTVRFDPAEYYDELLNLYGGHHFDAMLPLAYNAYPGAKLKSEVHDLVLHNIQALRSAYVRQQASGYYPALIETQLPPESVSDNAAVLKFIRSAVAANHLLVVLNYHPLLSRVTVDVINNPIAPVMRMGEYMAGLKQALETAGSVKVVLGIKTVAESNLVLNMIEYFVKSEWVVKYLGQ
ncbi:hypothetical protein H4R33_005677 [Dimargaris cristalligena]|nr:hypothetical protein H4R33_005677 [Dimargaris cristalligena]